MTLRLNLFWSRLCTVLPNRIHEKPPLAFSGFLCSEFWGRIFVVHDDKKKNYLWSALPHRQRRAQIGYLSRTSTRLSYIFFFVPVPVSDSLSLTHNGGGNCNEWEKNPPTVSPVNSATLREGHVETEIRTHDSDSRCRDDRCFSHYPTNRHRKVIGVGPECRTAWTRIPWVFLMSLSVGRVFG